LLLLQLSLLRHAISIAMPEEEGDVTEPSRAFLFPRLNGKPRKSSKKGGKQDRRNEQKSKHF
jgi:hypothetical protein